jgi:hypothetical protein
MAAFAKSWRREKSKPKRVGVITRHGAGKPLLSKGPARWRSSGGGDAQVTRICRARAACPARGFGRYDLRHWLHLDDPIIFWTARDPTFSPKNDYRSLPHLRSHNRRLLVTLPENCKGLLLITAARWPPTTMTKSKSRRAYKFTPQTIEKIKGMLARGLSRGEIARLLDVTVGSLQVTCSRLGISLRPSNRGLLSSERLKSQVPRGGLEVDLVEKRSRPGKFAIRMQQGDVLRTIDVPLSNKAIGELALLASLREVGLVELIAQILSGAVDKGLVGKILDGDDKPPKA